MATKPTEIPGGTLPARKDYLEPSVFRPENLLRQARRQKGIPEGRVPRVCALDPDGDVVRRLVAEGTAQPSPVWACYHTTLYETRVEGQRLGLVGCAVGASFAVLVAEQLFASGCELLVSVTSAGQLAPAGRPPYFVLIDRALRDEGTSLHYAPAAPFASADPSLIAFADQALAGSGVQLIQGGSWTTDAPYRETAGAIAAHAGAGLLAVEMEAAALYTFARVRARPVLCLAHVTNTMAQREIDFEKGDADGSTETLRVLLALANAWVTQPPPRAGGPRGL